MVNILISGYYGFDNIGDESILRTLVSSLREHIPDCSLTVLSHNPASTREKYGVEAVERMSPMAILRAVKKCDMLISGGGSLLQDVTSSKSLHYYLSIIRCAQFFRKKVFIYSQGIGPIDRPGNRRAAAKARKKADGPLCKEAVRRNRSTSAMQRREAYSSTRMTLGSSRSTSSSSAISASTSRTLFSRAVWVT